MAVPWTVALLWVAAIGCTAPRASAPTPPTDDETDGATRTRSVITPQSHPENEDALPALPDPGFRGRRQGHVPAA